MLYEVITLKKEYTPDFKELDDIRITSYNVCYTKLLRRVLV